MKHKRALDTLLAVSGTIVFLPILLLLFSQTFREFLFYHFHNALSLTSDASHAAYEIYAEEFQTVADYLSVQYAGAEDVCLIVSRGGVLSETGKKEYLSLPQSVTIALTILSEQDVFPQVNGLDTIRIHGSRIAFCTWEGKYALVYSPDKRPSFVNGPSETDRVFAESIEGGWYHVRKIPG